MISGLLMFGTTRHNKIVKILCGVALLISVFINNDFQNNTLFSIINLFLIVGIPLLLGITKNKYVGVFSILVYSVAIDIICFFMWQAYLYTNIVSYIFDGIMFNLKGILCPMLCCGIAFMLKKGIKNENKIISTR